MYVVDNKWNERFMLLWVNPQTGNIVERHDASYGDKKSTIIFWNTNLETGRRVVGKGGLKKRESGKFNMKS